MGVERGNVVNTCALEVRKKSFFIDPGRDTFRRGKTLGALGEKSCSEDSVLHGVRELHRVSRISIFY